MDMASANVMWRSGPIGRDTIEDLGQRWICIGLDIFESDRLDHEGRPILCLSGRFLLEQDVPKVFDWKIGYDRTS